MSQVMQALSSSQQGYQDNAVPNQYVTNKVSEEKSRFRWYHSILLLAPAAIVCGGLTYYTIESQKQKIANLLAMPVAVETVSASFDYLEYPQFSELKSTYVEPELTLENNLIEQTKVVSSESKVEPELQSAKPIVPQENTAVNLDQLDLSELSPALAMRVESALKQSATPNSAQTIPSDTVSLVQRAEQFTGRLPAMDFQTHVYARDVKKRWIKMNGIEYQEGDWMPDGVELQAITPRTVIVKFDNQSIEIPALHTWKG